MIAPLRLPFSTDCNSQFSCVQFPGWCARQESNLQSFRQSAFEAAAFANFATGTQNAGLSQQSTGELADSNRPDFGTCPLYMPHPHAGLARYKSRF